MSETQRILIVDENASDRAIFRRHLEESPDGTFEVAEADSGEDALAACQATRPHCLLLDCQLPDFDGLELLAKLQSSFGDPSAVVLLTNQGDESLAAQAMKQGAQDYLVKGDLTPASIYRAVNNAIEKAALTRAVQQHRKQLERSNRELQEFAYTASHDLQAPMRRIKSFCDLIKSRYAAKLDSEAAEFIGYLVESAAQMQALIDGLLQYSRAGSSDHSPQTMDMSLVVDEAVKNLQVAIRQSAAKVTRDELPEARCDAMQMVQLFQSLIENAINYRSEQPPEVHISAEVQSDMVRFSVKDNGIGIDPQYHEKIFVIFKRLHGDAEHPGTGIGLATCKKIVARHSGEIWVESELGAGSAFHFTLPLE